jgi:hypothetical protein
MHLIKVVTIASIYALLREWTLFNCEFGVRKVTVVELKKPLLRLLIIDASLLACANCPGKVF